MKKYIELEDKYGKIVRIFLPYNKIESDGSGCKVQWTEHDDSGIYYRTAFFSKSFEEITRLINQNDNTSK